MVSLPFDPLKREIVEGPPKGWRPRALTVMEKIEIVIRQKGKEPSGERLEPLSGLDFDHQPSIQARRWNPEISDTEPPSCDLRFIVALNRKTHRVKTASRDVPEIAKTRRLEAARDKDSPEKKKKPKIRKPWPKRSFRGQ